MLLSILKSPVFYFIIITYYTGNSWMNLIKQTLKNNLLSKILEFVLVIGLLFYYGLYINGFYDMAILVICFNLVMLMIWSLLKIK